MGCGNRFCQGSLKGRTIRTFVWDGHSKGGILSETVKSYLKCKEMLINFFMDPKGKAIQ